ncbi:MAG: flavodoxin family protein [Planctomycetota bacterium]|nr:flavodoxin family protein [Planctomycetota bacterium]
MKVLVLQGSPRKNGNTQTVVESVLAPIRRSGGEVEIIFAAEKKISGCRECFACQAPDKRAVPGCAIRDDMTDIYLKVLDADLVIMATPVFCWGMSAQLKAVCDRFFCFHKFEEGHNYTSLLRGKRFALIVTAAGDEFDGADLIVEQFQRFMEYMKAEDAGRLAVCSVESGEKLRTDAAVKERAEAFGRQLLKHG